MYSNIDKMETVLITGSSKGLGAELAITFGSKGYKVIIHGRDEIGLNSVQSRLKNLNVQYDIVRGDLRKNKTINDLREISKENNLIVLINNAAVHCPSLPINKLTNEKEDELIQTNLIAPIRLTREIYPIFLEKKQGVIMNMASLSALEPQLNRTAYSASKWGLRGFTESLRLEAQQNGIRVLGVYASRIKTRPEFQYGMEPSYAATKIYQHILLKSNSDLILDERPVQFRKKNEK